ncbi:hypothetical protein [uncultured Roseobacter sp.]|uniref:hypothetical protein n=1 Tax=uncultured Roseobacter sp. TaxID=114847 RepID=UPI00262597A6|nr:hypothetical protein [uncultured Roseobacter sp.]
MPSDNNQNEEPDDTALGGANGITNPASKISAEMCKEIYKENMGHYRYFGTMRARIAYAPATIALAVVSAFAVTNDKIRISMVFIVIVFALIYVINALLQKEQSICAKICKIAQEEWRNHISGNQGEPPNSKEFRRRAKDGLPMRGFRPDFASLVLLVFLVTLGSFPIAVLSPYATDVSQMADPEPSVVEPLLPAPQDKNIGTPDTEKHPEPTLP